MAQPLATHDSGAAACAQESAARWPFESDFRPWGFQAYYSKTSSKDVSSICYSDDPLCGINRVAQKDLTHSDVCDSALAPDGSFCSFGNDFAGQCYGGMSVSILHTIQNNTRIPLPRGIPQPADQQEQPWHPSEADGEQVASLVVEKKMPKPEDFFSLDVLKATRVRPACGAPTRKRAKLPTMVYPQRSQAVAWGSGGHLQGSLNSVAMMLGVADSSAMTTFHA